MKRRTAYILITGIMTVAVNVAVWWVLTLKGFNYRDEHMLVIMTAVHFVTILAFIVSSIFICIEDKKHE